MSNSHRCKTLEKAYQLWAKSTKKKGAQLSSYSPSTSGLRYKSGFQKSHEGKSHLHGQIFLFTHYTSKGLTLKEFPSNSPSPTANLYPFSNYLFLHLKKQQVKFHFYKVSCIHTELDSNQCQSLISEDSTNVPLLHRIVLLSPVSYTTI